MLNRFRDYLYGAFSDHGEPSCSRFLMGLFSVFTVGILWRIFSHLLKISNDGNVAVLSTWLGNLPFIIAALCALIALPYTVNQGTGAISSLAGMVSAYKGNKKSDAVSPDPKV